MIAFWSGRRWKLCKLWKIKETLHWCSANEQLIGAVQWVSVQLYTIYIPNYMKLNPEVQLYTSQRQRLPAVQCMLNWALCTSTPKPPGGSIRLKTTGKEERIWQFQISVWSYIIEFLHCHVNILQIISMCGWKAYSDLKKKSVMGVFLTHKILPGSDISKWGWERIFKEKYFK